MSVSTHAISRESSLKSLTVGLVRSVIIRPSNALRSDIVSPPPSEVVGPSKLIAS